jgi:phenylacetate-CoA ligase
MTPRADGRPLRVLMIGPEPPPVGGTTVLFMSLVEALEARDDVAIRVLRTQGVRGSGLGAPPALCGLISRVERTLAWSDVVALHVSTTGLHVLGPLVLHLARRASKPLLIRKFGGTDFSTFPWFRRRLIMWALRRADLYLAETRQLVQRARELGLRNVEWYPNSRSMPALAADSGGDADVCRHFVFLSQLYRAKGVLDLLDAAERLPDGVNVDIYGTLGFDVPASALQGRKGIVYRGPVEPGDVLDVLSSHDALVLPTYYPAEGYPGVILEAYAAGIPVISTRTGAIPELVDESTGILVDPRDVDALTAAMLSLASDPKLCGRLREGVLRMRNEFSDEVWKDRFVGYCSDLYEARGSGRRPSGERAVTDCQAGAPERARRRGRRMSFPLRRRVYESLPPVLTRAVGLVPFGWMAGRAYRDVLARHAFFEEASRDEVRAYQEKRLGEMLDFATDQVEAYAPMRSAVERLPAFDALAEFPLLSKEELQADMARFLPRDFERIPHYEITTGGTSGNQLRFYVDDASQSVETAFVHRLWSRVGYTPRSRKAAFRGVPFPDLRPGVYWKSNPVYNEMQFSPYHMSESTLGAYVDELLRYDPSYFHGYPSAIDLLAEYVLRNGLTDSFRCVRAVLLVSEAVTTPQRERIESAFGARAFAMYGHSERLIMGGECEVTSVYHQTPDYGVMEVVGDDGAQCRPGERGELVGTGLLNRSMPLIRYRTGDRATLLEPSCECGRHWDRFSDIEGRWKQDMLEGRSGARISLTALNMHGPLFDRVTRYQYYQKKPGSCTLRVMPAPGFSERDEATILKAFRAKVGEELLLTIEVVDDIPLTERGKLRLLIRPEDEAVARNGDPPEGPLPGGELP